MTDTSRDRNELGKNVRTRILGQADYAHDHHARVTTNVQKVQTLNDLLEH